MESTRPGIIVAMSSGVFAAERPAQVLKEYLLALTDTPRPKVCYLPTASGDPAEAIVAFYSAFSAERCFPSHLGLFNRTVKDLRPFILSQDLIVVGGGNTANMLAIWRTQGLAGPLREAWQRGIVLCGWSAGGLCWFDSGSTDSFGRDLSPLDGCLGFLPGSFCPHYDTEERRRPTYHRFIAEGLLPSGWALDNDTALQFEGTTPRRIVASRLNAMVYRVEKVGDEARETPIEPELLA